MTTILSIYEITCTVFMTSPALYMIWYIYFVWYHIHYMCDITQWCHLWHYTLYVYDMSTLYGITHSVMTTQPLCDFTATVSDITPTESVSSHAMYQFYQTQCMHDITATICMTSYALHMTSHALFMTSHLLIYYIKSTISAITSTVSMISQPLYVWYHTQYTCDILSTIFMTSYPLCMTSQHCVLLTPHSAYVWHPLHYRWHHIPSITPKHSIYDVTSTSGMTLHQLFQISQPLYLCHHNLSTDITPTFVCHHTHSMCDNICTPYNIILLLMLSRCCTFDITNSIYETTSIM